MIIIINCQIVSGYVNTNIYEQTRGLIIMERLIYIQKNGENIGPFSRLRVIKMLMDKELSNADLGWHEGLTQWQTVHKIVNSDIVKLDVENFKSLNMSKKNSPIYNGYEGRVQLMRDPWEAVIDQVGEGSDEGKNENIWYSNEFIKPISQKVYALSVLSILLISIPILVAMSNLPETYILFGYIAYALVALVINLFLIMGRLKDINRPWHDSLMLFLPILNIVLIIMCIFAPSQLPYQFIQPREPAN